MPLRLILWGEKDVSSSESPTRDMGPLSAQSDRLISKAVTILELGKGTSKTIMIVEKIRHTDTSTQIDGN
jgi:hypothetical protein